MFLLYSSRYSKRLQILFPHIRGKTLNELCFGDTLVAAYCGSHNIDWQGYDVNNYFVKRAVRKGYAAANADIMTLKRLNTGDTALIAGSLYHFINNGDQLFELLMLHHQRVIISEPVINLSSDGNLPGKVARFFQQQAQAMHHNFSTAGLYIKPLYIMQKSIILPFLNHFCLRKIRFLYLINP
jgi:hypothetical protein